MKQSHKKVMSKFRNNKNNKDNKNLTTYQV